MAALTAADIRRLLTDFIGRHQPTLIATVKDVDETDYTCTLVDDETEIPAVRLHPLVGENKGIVRVPKIGTYVIATQIETSDEWLIEAAEEYDKILIVVGKTTIAITDGDIEINGGKLGGLVKISELTDKINGLVDKFNTHTHNVTTTGTSAAQTGTASATMNIASQFSKSDYEDTAIKH